MQSMNIYHILMERKNLLYDNGYIEKKIKSCKTVKTICIVLSILSLLFLLFFTFFGQNCSDLFAYSIIFVVIAYINNNQIKKNMNDIENNNKLLYDIEIELNKRNNI